MDLVSDTHDGIPLDPELKNEIERLAEREGRSVSELVRAALRAYEEDRTEWLRALDEGIEAAESGRVVDDDKVDAWLASWGTDDELEPPTCD